jgi:hypothetical protein
MRPCTSAFSKKFENHAHVVALYTICCKFARQHKAHRLSPAMAARIADRLWSIKDIAELVEAAAPKPRLPGPYRRRTKGSK